MLLHVLREVSSHCGPCHQLEASLLRQDLKGFWGSQFWARPNPQLLLAVSVRDWKGLSAFSLTHL